MNINSVIATNSIIIGLLVIVFPILIVILLSFFKFKFSKKISLYLYAFATGLIMMLGVFGFLREAYVMVNNHFSNAVDYVSITLTIVIIVSGCIFGLIISFLIRYLVVKTNSKGHGKDHQSTFIKDGYEHNENIFNLNDIKNKEKWIPLFLIIFHKLIDGLSLGFLISTSTTIFGFASNFGLIIGFIIHIIPTTIILYYIQIEMKTSKVKAILNIFYMSIAIIPFIFMGGYFGDAIKSIYWVLPFLYSFSGTIMVFIAIVELIPEYIHNRIMDNKCWYLSTTYLSIGLVLGIILTLIRTG